MGSPRSYRTESAQTYRRRSLSLTLPEAALEQDLDPGEAQQDAERRVGGVVSERRGKLVFEQGLDAGQAEKEVVQIVFVGRQAQAAAGPGPNGPNVPIWALNAHRYRFRHREFHFALNWLGNYRFGGSQFSGMILSADFGGRTPVLFCSLWLEGTRSGSPGCAGPVPHP